MGLVVMPKSSDAGAPAPVVVPQQDIAKAARHTLMLMQGQKSIGQLALRYAHVADPTTKHIAFATEKKCVYGPRFATMDRYSQTFVVAHETMHHVLGHIEHGAVLYRREGSRFCPLGFNIAADAIINYVLEQLPDVDKLGPSIRYGVRKCQEFGIVNWEKLTAEIASICQQINVAIDPIWRLTPDKLSVVDIYHALMRLRRQHQEKNPPKAGGEPCEGEGDGDMIKDLADALDAHDDLFDAIKETSKKGEGELLDQISRQEDLLRRVQASAGKGDVVLRVKAPDGLTKTPWPQALRRMASTALLHRPNIDHGRPSRRMICQIGRALDPRTPDASRPTAIPFEPRTSANRPGKKCVTIFDTSGSVFSDKETVRDWIREVTSICKRVNSTQTIIFADAEVCEIVNVEDSFDKIAKLEPKGGGATDFRPAITLAESLRPDLIIYLTDLCGTFPDKPPKAPIIWAFPPEWEMIETPFGKRLPLNP